MKLLAATLLTAALARKSRKSRGRGFKHQDHHPTDYYNYYEGYGSGYSNDYYYGNYYGGTGSGHYDTANYYGNYDYYYAGSGAGSAHTEMPAPEGSGSGSAETDTGYATAGTAAGSGHYENLDEMHDMKMPHDMEYDMYMDEHYDMNHMEEDCAPGNPMHYNPEMGMCNQEQHYCNGWCEHSCPEGMRYHRQCFWNHETYTEECSEEYCIPEKCPEGQFPVWNWTQDGEQALCVPGAEAEIEESFPEPMDKMCWEFSYWDSANYIYVEYVWSWENDMATCIRYKQCPFGHVQLWGREGQRGCSGDYQKMECTNGIRSGFEDDGHWVETCVHGTPSDSAPKAANFHHHEEHHDKDDSHAIEMCVVENCMEVFGACQGDMECAELMEVHDDHFAHCATNPVGSESCPSQTFGMLSHCVSSHCLEEYIAFTHDTSGCDEDCHMECLKQSPHFMACMSQDLCATYFQEAGKNAQDCMESLREGNECSEFPEDFRGTVEHYLHECHGGQE